MRQKDFSVFYISNSKNFKIPCPRSHWLCGHLSNILAERKSLRNCISPCFSSRKNVGKKSENKLSVYRSTYSLIICKVGWFFNRSQRMGEIQHNTYLNLYFIIYFQWFLSENKLSVYRSTYSLIICKVGWFFIRDQHNTYLNLFVLFIFSGFYRR